MLGMRTVQPRIDHVANAARLLIPHVLCHACGYEPPANERQPDACPKCNGGAWEYFVWRGKINQTEIAPDDADVPRKRGRPRGASHRNIHIRTRCKA